MLIISGLIYVDNFWGYVGNLFYLHFSLVFYVFGLESVLFLLLFACDFLLLGGYFAGYTGSFIGNYLKNSLCRLGSMSALLSLKMDVNGWSPIDMGVDLAKIGMKNNFYLHLFRYLSVWKIIQNRSKISFIILWMVVQSIAYYRSKHFERAFDVLWMNN